MPWDVRTGGGSAARSASELETLLLNYTDAHAGGGGGWLPTWLTRYVDPVNGSDSNNGLSQATAYATIPHGYSELVADAVATYGEVGAGLGMGVGRLILSPDEHVLTARMDMDFKYPCEFIGTRSGRHSHLMSNSATVLRMNSTTAAAFFRVSGTNVGYGWRFEGISVAVDQTAVTGNVGLTSIWDFQNVDDFVIENCGWDTLDNNTNLNIPAINHDASLTPPTGDAAWFRIRNNRYSRLALYDGGGAGASGNFNRWTMLENVGFYGGTIPHVKFNDGSHGGQCENNNFEGTAVGVELAGGVYTQNMWINNSGEDPSGGTPPNPFYKFSGSVSQQIIIGGSITVPGGGNGVFVEFGANAYNNLVVGPFNYAGVAGEKRKIVDGATSYRNYIVPTTGTPVIPTKISSGTPTWADSDFAPTPMDGTHAIGINTTTGERRLWFRANGSWGYVSSIGAGVPTWTGLAYAANFADHGVAGDQAGEYALDSLGFVHLRGLVKKTTATSSGEVIATLPAGFRPAALEYFTGYASYSGGNLGFVLSVNSDGTIRWYTTSSVAWTGAALSLSGITFAQGA